jgi:two-component system NarL family sensor kinase
MHRKILLFSLLLTIGSFKSTCSEISSFRDFNNSKKYQNNDKKVLENDLHLNSAVEYDLRIFDSAFSVNYWECVNGIYCKILDNCAKNQAFVNSEEYLFYLLVLNKNYNGNKYLLHTTYDSIGQYYLRNNKIEKAYDCFSKIISDYSGIEKKENYPLSKSALTGIATFFRKYGNKLKAEGNNDKAIIYYKKSLEISELLGNKQDIANCYNNLGTSYNDIGKNEVALEYYLNSLKLNEELKNKKLIAYSNLNIGAVYHNEGDTLTSLNYYAKALAIAQEIKDRRCVATCYSNIGGLYNYQGNYARALKFYKYALAVFEELEDIYGIFMCFINVGICYMNLDDFDKSMEFLKKAYNKSKESSDNYILCSSSLNIAELYLKKKDNINAIFFAKEGLKLAKEIKVVSFEHKAYNVLKDAYYKEKDYRQAFDFYGLYLSTNDSLFNKEKARQIIEIEAKYETNKKEKEIEIQALKISEQQIQLGQNRIILISMIILILFTILFIILLLNRYRIKQRILNKNQLIEQQKQYTLSIIDMQEKDRTRIARDLHDGIGQSLAGIISNFDELSKAFEKMPATQQHLFNVTSRTIDEAYAELRNLSHQMMPRALKVAGLSAAISDLLEKTLVNTNISYSFKNEEPGTLPESISISVYRIFQELFGNIIKHAKADKITVDLLVSQNQLVLIVEDNGMGISSHQDTKKPGMGLFNINARVQSLQGSFIIEPSSVKGTVATIIIPLL